MYVCKYVCTCTSSPLHSYLTTYLLVYRCLERLELSHLSAQVTDSFLESVIHDKLYRLQYLDLKACHRVTDKGIRLVVTACRGLQELVMADLPGLKDDGVQVGVCM